MELENTDKKFQSYGEIERNRRFEFCFVLTEQTKTC